MLADVRVLLSLCGSCFPHCTQGLRFPPAGDDDGPAIKRATYKELESITADLSAFPNVQFFRVEASRAESVQLCLALPAQHRQWL